MNVYNDLNMLISIYDFWFLFVFSFWVMVDIVIVVWVLVFYECDVKVGYVMEIILFKYSCIFVLVFEDMK